MNTVKEIFQKEKKICHKNYPVTLKLSVKLTKQMEKKT